MNFTSQSLSIRKRVLFRVTVMKVLYIKSYSTDPSHCGNRFLRDCLSPPDFIPKHLKHINDGWKKCARTLRVLKPWANLQKSISGLCTKFHLVSDVKNVKNVWMEKNWAITYFSEVVCFSQWYWGIEISSID